MFSYSLLSLLTSPGVIIHELGHAIFCLLSGTKIHRIKLFQFGTTAGFVVHDEPASFFQAMLISFGPLLVNSLATLILFSRLTLPYPTIQNLFLLWLGLAIGLHAIPSNGDAQSFLSTTNHHLWKNPISLLGYPLILTLYLLNLLKRLHLDFLYVVFLLWLGHIYLK